MVWVIPAPWAGLCCLPGFGGDGREPGLGKSQLNLYMELKVRTAGFSCHRVRSQAGHLNLLGLSFPLGNGESSMSRGWKGGRNLSMLREWAESNRGIATGSVELWVLILALTLTL